MNTRKLQGFTIIEVVLVLAIAGLIFLMVFIALPALQKGQRDTQRRNDVSRFRAQVNQYQANNKGLVPTPVAPATYATLMTGTTGTFVIDYLANSGGWKDPLSGNDYNFKTWTTNKATTFGATPVAGDWTYVANGKCNGEDIISGGVGTRTYVILMKLEGAGYNCQDNQ